MLSEALKQEIQSAYRQFLASKSLKPRYGQRVMIAGIANVLGGVTTDEEGKRDGGSPFYVVEAGTGTGKTVAYCLAAIPVARALGKHLVISTATVALQEQIVHKDLPDILEHSGLSFDFSLVKGRGRYLCLAKLDRLLQSHGELDPNQALFEDELAARLGDDEVRLYNRMAGDLASQRWDGDRDNWPETIDDGHWQRVTTDHRQCTNRRCSHFKGCSFFQARRELEQADCLVVNHDLLLADLALGGGAILTPPGDTIYIFDEGHHLPDKALSHFSHQLRFKAAERWFRQQSRTLQKLRVRLGEDQTLDGYLDKSQDAFQQLEEGLSDGYQLVRSLLVFDESEDKEALLHRLERGEVPAELREYAEQVRMRFSRLERVLESIAGRLRDLVDDEGAREMRELAEEAYPLVGRLLARCEAGLMLCASYATEVVSGEMPLARWVTLHQGLEGEDVELASSPILAAQTLRKHLWSQCYAGVVTSATLTALGRFDRLVMRTGLPQDSQFSQVPSPFNYAESASLVVPAMSADPADPDRHTEELCEQLKTRIRSDQGALVLFSSWRQMNQVLDRCSAPWVKDVLAQGALPKQELLKQHRQRIDQGQGSVIFGLASFAEGIDLPGDYLTHVVIAKLPFGVPDQPVDAALAEWISERGGNPFMEVTVPDASVKLVQAAGRLLRSETDRGVVSLMDRRVVTRRYGQLLLDALPPFQRVIE